MKQLELGFMFRNKVKDGLSISKTLHKRFGSIPNSKIIKSFKIWSKPTQ